MFSDRDHKTLAAGEPMPDVTVTHDGQPVRLRDLLEPGGLVVYFYPKDDTTGCTAESCSFRDAYEDFLAAGADVVGISGDDADSHRAFASKHRLPFRLLTDNGGKARAAFGVRRPLGGMLAGRVTFVFDGQGICRYVFESQIRVFSHVAKALDTIRSFPPAPATP